MLEENNVLPTLPNVVYIPFGEKPTADNIWEGSWNGTYEFKTKRESLNYWPHVSLKINYQKKKVLDADVLYLPNFRLPKYPPSPKQTPLFYWLNPYFWIQEGFYRPSNEKRIEWEYFKSECVERHPFDEDFMNIIDDIWQIFLIYEEVTQIDHYDFIRSLHLLRFFIENTLIFPVTEMDWENWKLFGCQYLEETPAHSQIDETKLHGWSIADNEKNMKKVSPIFLSDLKYILNTLLYTYIGDSGAEIFLRKLILSFTKELQDRKILKTCSFCNRFFLYSTKRKYCSLIEDGKDCGTSARNKRYYANNRKTILPKARVNTREQRAFYKKKGINK